MLAQKPFLAPRNLSHLEENLGAASIALMPAHLRDIDDARRDPGEGARLPEAVLKLTDR